MHKCRPNNSESFRLDRRSYLEALRSLLVSPNYREDVQSWYWLPNVTSKRCSTRTFVLCLQALYKRHCVLASRYLKKYDEPNEGRRLKGIWLQFWCSARWGGGGGGQSHDILILSSVSSTHKAFNLKRYVSTVHYCIALYSIGLVVNQYRTMEV